MNDMKPSVILTINVGSSSLKFALYRMGRTATEVDLMLSGKLERIGASGGRFVAHDNHHVDLVDRQIELPNYEAALKTMLDWPIIEAAQQGR